MFAKAVALGPFAQQVPGFFACRHSFWSPRKNIHEVTRRKHKGKETPSRYFARLPGCFSTLILSAGQEDEWTPIRVIFSAGLAPPD
jgi:hypothetical protein